MSNPLPPVLNIKLTPDGVQAIANALAEFPYKQVFMLVRDLEQQCMAQAAAYAAEKAAAEGAEKTEA